MSAYEKTMERLRHLTSAGRPLSDKLAIEMLSDKIDSYRNQVERMRAQMQSTKKAYMYAPDCTKCGYGPVWNDVCRACKAKSAASRGPEGKAAGSGATARRTEVDNIKDQLVRKGDVFNQITDIIAVPYMMPEKDMNNITEWTQRYISGLTSLIRALPPAGTAEPLEDLRTCPFCGGTARLVESAAEFNEDMAWVKCNRCGARTRPHFGPSRVASAVSSWNQRPDPTARAEANEDIIRNLIGEIESLRETIANLRKGSVSEDRVTEIAETATRNFKRAAMREIEKLQMPIMRSQNPGDRYKFSGMSEAKEATRELPPDLEE